MSETSIVAGKEQERYYPYSSIFYANRHSFWTAGQDSWTLPPAQNQDHFLQLLNVEPVLQGVLQRRRGYNLFSKAFAGTGPTFTRSYGYRNDGQGLRRVVWVPFNQDGISGPVATDEKGVTIANPIYTIPLDALFAPRMVLSRDFGYFSDGSQAGMLKWDGTTGTNAVTNWGIAVGGSPLSVFGPSNTGTGSDVPFTPGPLTTPGVPWSNPTNIQGPSDNTYATVTIPAGGGVQHSDTLYASNFGFNIPAASTVGAITGIQITITGFSDFLFPPGSEGINITLIKANGTAIGAGFWVPVQNINTPTVYGGNGDLFGTTWTNADFNGPNFGVQIEGFNGGSGPDYTLNVDSIAVTVTTAGGSITFTPVTTTTNVVLLSGRTYTYAFQNSKTLTTSDLGPFSASTGPQVGNQLNLSNIPASTDPQVDTVLILATADGNDETTLYLLGTVPNGTSTFTDTIPDALSPTYTVGPTLLSNLLYQDTDAFGNLHGLANNARPPVGLNYMVKHKGRIYGAVGRALYYSKNLDDVTTANALITCKWEEAWPTINQFDISDQAETIQGLLSDGETLWIGTERGIRRLIGDSPANFQIPEVQFNEAGLYNMDSWRVTFYEGQPVGTLWLTPDFKVMASDFNTYQDVGTPIQDVLNSITPLNSPNGTPIVHASYVSKGPADYYMLYIPTNGRATPNTICVYDLRKKVWFIWQPTDTVTTSLFLLDQQGNPRWLFAEPNGAFYEWTYGTFTDRVGNVAPNAPTTYPVTIQTTWFDMGDYGIRKFVNQIIPTTADNAALTVQVEAASNEQDFNTPATVIPPTTVIPASIPDDVFVPLASGPSHHRAFRFTFVSPPSTVQNVLTGFSVEAGVIHRYGWYLIAGIGLIDLFARHLGC